MADEIESMPALVLVGGIDPSGGAGLVRDVWAIENSASAAARRGGRASTRAQIAIVPSAWTWQGRAGGQRVRAQAVDPRAFAEGLRRAGARSLAAVKIGLLPMSLVPALAHWLAVQRAANPELKVVLDPVLRASEGTALGASVSSLWTIVEQVDVVTPNPHEAARLDLQAGSPAKAGSPGGSPGAALLERGLARGSHTAWLLKSTHKVGGKIYDELWSADAPVLRMGRASAGTADPRGTGCALASALALELARGETLAVAAQRAGDWLATARTRTRPGPDGRPHMRG